MAVRRFDLPDLGEGLAEAEIVEWHVSVGERVVADQPLVSVETDKAVVEVPSPWSGTVTALLADPGEVLEIGAPLAEIEDTSRADTGAIVGELEPRQAPPEPAFPTPPQEPEAASGVRAAPAARARASAIGVDLASVRGTGPGGAISLADVEAAGGGSAPAPVSAGRRSMARAMAKAHAEVVPASVTDVVDVTAWHDADANVMVRLVRAVCAGVAAEPALNTWYDPEGVHGVQPDGVSLGIAVDTPQGLYVPVIARAGTLGPAELRASLDAAITRVRERRPEQGEPRRPSISLSNFGAIAGRHAALVVVPPQVAILGAGRIHDGIAWRDGAPVRTTELPLSLTFDHRAVTGGEAARFLAAVIADLEKPD